MDSFLITCEHGGNRVPPAYRSLFRGHQALLHSHRGYDPGALTMARALARELGAPLLSSTVSRLLIDLNRSIGHPHSFSEITRDVSTAVRDDMIRRYYLPYRREAERWVAHEIGFGRRVVHLSSHSFTPEMNGEVRNADVGFLYDPRRRGEVELCARWKASMAACAPEFKVRRNYPYAGKADGLTSFLRRRHPPTDYVGVELELNQKYRLDGGKAWRVLRVAAIESLRVALSPRRRSGV